MKPSFPSDASAGREELTRVASWPRLRALAWDEKTLYASRRYTLLRATPENPQATWSEVGRFNPQWWRHLSSVGRLSSRLCRDGFHALAVLPSGEMVAAVPGAIVTLAPGHQEFRITHRIRRGTRPLNIAVTSKGWVFWGEYFSNNERDEVHIYWSQDAGQHWEVVHTFPRRTVRHVHNILYDRWANCLWILTGDNGEECKVLRASCDWKEVELVISGHQQARAVAAVPTEEALYFASDTPLEANYIYRMARSGEITRLTPLSGSALYGCRAGSALFFSTMVEPSEVNSDRNVRLYGSWDGNSWRALLEWPKDHWPVLFQYGTAALPSGHNTTGLLAVSCVAVEGGDLQTSIWRVVAQSGELESARFK